MATVTASHFVSHIHGGATSVDSKTNLAQIGLRSQPITHNGLRSVNTVDMLQIRNNVKVTAKQSRNMVKKTDNDRSSGKIICETGMNLIFVAAECGPWSKTGGLGDVLGGLPPAMAVSIFLPACFYLCVWTPIHIFYSWRIWAHNTLYEYDELSFSILLIWCVHLLSRQTGTEWWLCLHGMISIEMLGTLVCLFRLTLFPVASCF